MQFEMWQVPKMWEGGEVWIIGGGPSLIDTFDIPYDVVKNVRLRKQGIQAYSPYLAAIHSKHVIGINVAYQFGNWVDICFFGDKHFFLQHKGGLSHFKKLVVTCTKKVGEKNLNWVKYLPIEKAKGQNKLGISTNPNQVCWNENSGAAAISLAAWLGVKRIILVGFDMTLSSFNNEQHFHNEYKPFGAKVKEKQLPFKKHLQPWQAIKRDADAMGIEIFNLSPNSAIKEFPKISLEKALSISGSKINESKKSKITENTTKEFSEWIRYYAKNTYPNFDASVLIDKYKVKDFVKGIVKSAKVFQYFKSQKEIIDFDFHTLPTSFVIKATHGSGWFILVNKGLMIDKKYFVNGKPQKLNIGLVKKKMAKWLNDRYKNDTEVQYAKVQPGIIIEEYLGDESSEEHLYFNDYKFNCINGKIEFIRHCDTLDKNQGYFDVNWNLLPFKRIKTKKVTNYPKPANLDEMVKVVRQLLQKVKNPPFIRVDLITNNKDIYFGEFTLSPSGGKDSYLIPNAPSEDKNKYERIYGEKIDKGILKVICFKWKHLGGFRLPSLNVVGEYKADHVNRLYHSVERNTTIPHEFICITDDPTGIECRTLPMWDDYREFGGCYTRLKLFSKEMEKFIGKRFIMIDLDTVITGNLDNLFSKKEDFIIYPQRSLKFEGQWCNGSLIMMDAGARSQVWETFMGKESVKVVEQNREKGTLVGTDQAWISLVLIGRNEKLFSPKEDGVTWFQFLPKDNKLPPGVKLVTFAGKRDPSQELNVKWVKENWV